MKRVFVFAAALILILSTTQTTFAQLGGGTEPLPGQSYAIPSTYATGGGTQIFPEPQYIRQADVDTLIDAIYNTEDINYRLSGNMRILMPFDINEMMNLRIFMTIMKVGNSVSQSFRFNVHAEDMDKTMDARGSMKVLSDGEETFVRFGKFKIDTNDEEITDILSDILDNGLNESIANTYLRLDFLEELHSLSNEIDDDIYEGLEFFQESDLEPIDIVKKFLTIASGRVINITNRRGKFTIRPARGITRENAEAFAHDFYYFMKDDLKVPDISESDYEDIVDSAYEGINNMLSEINRSASIFIQIFTSDNKVTRFRFSLRSKDFDFPVSISGNFRYIKRVPRRISMPRCFIDMVDLFDILHTIDIDSDDNTYFKQTLEELRSQKSCR
jgi:hypothetical protein